MPPCEVLHLAVETDDSRLWLPAQMFRYLADEIDAGRLNPIRAIVGIQTDDGPDMVASSALYRCNANGAETVWLIERLRYMMMFE